MCACFKMEFPSDAPAFSVNGTRTVRVVSMHDGDTFTSIFRFEQAFYKFSVRLGRIDTAEMTSKDPRAYIARNRLFEMITSSSGQDTFGWRKKDFDNYFNRNPTHLTINCTGMDKYGRVLADVGDFAETLVKEKLAYWYDGGTKTGF
jgi:endonuclease YncB( thermonuclease family)